MVEAAGDPEPSRFRRTMARAVWPVALATPVVPVVASVLVRPPGSGDAADSFLFQLLGICAVLLLATVCGARLVEAQWRRRARRELDGRQSLAVLAVGLGAAWFSVGVASFEGPLPGLVQQAIIHGLFACVVGIGALIVVTLGVLRADRADRSDGDRGDD